MRRTTAVYSRQFLLAADPLEVVEIIRRDLLEGADCLEVKDEAEVGAARILTVREAPEVCNDRDGDGFCDLCAKVGGCSIFQTMKRAKPGMRAHCAGCNRDFTIREILNDQSGLIFVGDDNKKHAARISKLLDPEPVDPAATNGKA